MQKQDSKALNGFWPAQRNDQLGYSGCFSASLTSNQEQYFSETSDRDGVYGLTRFCAKYYSLRIWFKRTFFDVQYFQWWQWKTLLFEVICDRVLTLLSSPKILFGLLWMRELAFQAFAAYIFWFFICHWRKQCLRALHPNLSCRHLLQYQWSAAARPPFQKEFKILKCFRR